MKFIELTGKYKERPTELTIAINPLKIQYIEPYEHGTIIVFNDSEWFKTLTPYSTVKTLLEGATE